jgi:hypothetical protein
MNTFSMKLDIKNAAFPMLSLIERREVHLHPTEPDGNYSNCCISNESHFTKHSRLSPMSSFLARKYYLRNILEHDKNIKKSHTKLINYKYSHPSPQNSQHYFIKSVKNY